MATVGVDLNSEAFWMGGFQALEKLVGDLQAALHAAAQAVWRGQTRGARPGTAL